MIFSSVCYVLLNGYIWRSFLVYSTLGCILAFCSVVVGGGAAAAAAVAAVAGAAVVVGVGSGAVDGVIGHVRVWVGGGELGWVMVVSVGVVVVGGGGGM